MWNWVKRKLPRSLKRSVRRIVRNVKDSIRYRLLKSDFEHGKRRHVIFVCKGNICRSAFAEHYLRQQVVDGSIVIESCGIDVDQGMFSPPEAISAAKEFDVNLEQHHSKGIGFCNMQCADFIFSMELQQHLQLISMFPEKKQQIRLMSDFAPFPDRLFSNIDDPFGAGLDEFRLCFRRLQRTINNLTDYLIEKPIEGETQQAARREK